MHELIYDNDVTVAGHRHTLEVYLDATRCHAAAVFLPAIANEPHAQKEALNVARTVIACVAPDARPVVQPHRPRGQLPMHGTTPESTSNDPRWQHVPPETALEAKIETLRLVGLSQP